MKIPAENRRAGSPAASFRDKKRSLDWKVLSAIAYPVFTVGLHLSVFVARKRFRRYWKSEISYKDVGYEDLISYLHSVRGIEVSRNATNDQYQISAEPDTNPNELDMRLLLLAGDGARD